ncbi:MAG TPA: hypothetical protein VFV50_02670 [Bdellovibrionales bacterium]|nr:hypothetical protein [Bdellovibrionales bacterium]
MKVILTALLTFVSFGAHAKTLSCHTKRFVFNDYKVVLTAKAGSDDSQLSDFSLTVDGETIRSARNLAGGATGGRHYANMVAFSLDGPGVRAGGPYWDSFSMELLLPSGFSKARAGERFVGVVVETLSNYGTHNTVLCELVP